MRTELSIYHQQNQVVHTLFPREITALLA
jgi:hypothetical protein